MRFGSVCSGIEAASCAWLPLGWECAFVSEIEAFPCAVLQHHYPETPNRGDMTKFKEWPDACRCDASMVPSGARPLADGLCDIATGDGKHAGARPSGNLDGRGAFCNECGGIAIEVLVGGTPCQSFSVAGLRKGLDDPRGNLMLTYLAIAAKYRPAWLVWENVPGVLSSNGGRDFASFLRGLAELGYGFAYRILDAQFFGVPQRRRRVFVVGCLGDWRRAAAVLFERHSLSGHPAPRREAGKGVADRVGDSLTKCRASSPDEARGTANLIVAGDITHSLRADGFDASEDGTGRGTPLVPIVSPTLTRRMGGASNQWAPHNEADHLLPVAFAQNQLGEVRTDLNTLNTLNTNSNASGRNTPMVAFAQNTRDEVREMPYAGALASDAGMKQTSYIRNGMQVRRLTPRECERLQGFPAIREVIRIEACLDRQNLSVHVALSCLKWQENVSRADAEKWPRFAPVAASRSSISPADQEPLAALRARTVSVDELLEIHSHGRSIWSASNAGASSAFRLPAPSVNIAADLVQPSRVLAQAIRAGKVESLQSIKLSFQASRGERHASQSGAVSAASVSDAINDARAGKFTTSLLGATAPTCDSREATLLCSVLAVISGSIPSETLPERFSLEVDLETPYTLIPYRNKPAADGPRYKALGNSMAVPVMAWIGARIQMLPAEGMGVETEIEHG